MNQFRFRRHVAERHPAAFDLHDDFVPLVFGLVEICGRAYHYQILAIGGGTAYPLTMETGKFRALFENYEGNFLLVVVLVLVLDLVEGVRGGVAKLDFQSRA